MKDAAVALFVVVLVFGGAPPLAVLVAVCTAVLVLAWKWP